ncbi:MAG: SET domain-containing protein-lysine N-methyltransferase, partial [gamma proteobacterium symbiont of Lucinoma myriamae]|nr:SET domain-containing protein-lysine N-methyltransferase [gamma proteobacterium symbiont of Lucinoma myriamae]MCU7833396.1 SET domain-containing protein-lysine N-methyltransferase [gamma proteobacterium symbiont of Lucinoma myriamae]
LQPREKQFNYEKFGAGYYVVAWATAFFRINHSSQPNSQFIVSTRWKTVRIEAMREIQPGEEIFIDYGIDYWQAKGITMDD